MSTSRTASQTVATELAQWVHDLSFDELPTNVVDMAKDCVRDAIACAVLGSSRPRMKAFEAVITPLHQGGAATVIRAPWRANVPDAVFINAMYIHGCELDDGMTGAGGHPSSVTVPVALALAETDGRNGRDILTAVVAGYDVLHRATAPIHPDFVKRGFQGTGIGGPFGATAVAAKLRGISAELTAQAFAIAGCYCSGLCEYDQSGGETKRLYAGRSARAGVESMNLAVAGVDGPLTIFEGKRGVYAGFAFDDHIDMSRATSGLGTEYRILRHAVKPYPTVGTCHGPIEAIATLWNDSMDPDKIEDISVLLPPGRKQHGGAIQVPHDLVEAQFSTAFSIAVRILYASNDISLYESEAVRSDPRVIALCNKVTVSEMSEDEKIAKDNGAAVTLKMADGYEQTNLQSVAPGTPGNPFTSEKLRERFFTLTREHLSESAQLDLDAAISHLEDLESVDELLRPLRPSPDTR